MSFQASWLRASPGLSIAATLVVACSGSADAPRVANEEPPPTAIAAPPTTSAPAAPPASAAPSAGASALASATPAAPKSRCPAGMAEVGGGKFKSSYYRADMTVAPFCIDVNLTTTAAYAACVDSGKCDKTALGACDPSSYKVDGRDDWPMICVDFGQAEKFCTAQGKHIVSDVEWEWAARGGDEALTYPWGADPPGDQLCWSGTEKRTTPCPVGKYPPNKSGIFDLAGNINQWTTTTNDSIGSFRVGRGGSWKDGVPKQVAVTAHGGFKNTYRCGFLGIRCSQAVP